MGSRPDLDGQTGPNLDEGDGRGGAAAELKLEGERPTFNDNDREDTHRTKMDKTAIRRRTIGRRFLNDAMTLTYFIGTRKGDSTSYSRGGSPSLADRRQVAGGGRKGAKEARRRRQARVSVLRG